MPNDVNLQHYLTPAIWVIDNKFINENQKPFEFTKHRFMIEPYNDHSPDQAIMKSAQVGWSMAAILKSIHACNYLGLNIIYTLPTRNASGEFVVPKVNPLIQRNEAIKALVKNTDNKNLKQIGDRFLYFRGTQHEGEAISTSADLIVADELDRSNQAVLITMQSRLQASDYGWFWRFSNPSVPGFGIHEWYQDSDQRHWLVRCHNCNHEYYMGLEQDSHINNHYVDPERRIYACGKCHKEITTIDRQNGRWLAKYPSRSRRGYWLSQMMIPWVTAEKILEQQRQMTIDVFHNMVLGLPYQASEFLINREAIMKARMDGIATKDNCFMGVDSGKEKHFVLGNSTGIFSYGKVKTWEEIEALINMYKATTVIDALPDFTVPEYLSRKYAGQVYVNYYVHDSKQMEVSVRNQGVNYGRVDSDRTKLFDLMAAEITQGKLQFYMQPETLEELIYHFSNVYRIVEPDTKGIERAKWEKKENKPDHFAHATAYYVVAKSFGLGPTDSGGVLLNNGATIKKGITVKDGKIAVKDALGTNLENLVEQSLKRNKRSIRE